MSVTIWTANEHSAASDECRDVDNNTMVQRRACLNSLPWKFVCKENKKRRSFDIFAPLLGWIRSFEEHSKALIRNIFPLLFILFLNLLYLILTSISTLNQYPRSASITFCFYVHIFRSFNSSMWFNGLFRLWFYEIHRIFSWIDILFHLELFGDIWK